LGRFAQADTIVPGGVQGLDRYAYVNNSPLNYVDPSGHSPCNGEFCSEDGYGSSHGRGSKPEYSPAETPKPSLDNAVKKDFTPPCISQGDGNYGYCIYGDYESIWIHGELITFDLNSVSGGVQGSIDEFEKQVENYFDASANKNIATGVGILSGIAFVGTGLGSLATPPLILLAIAAGGTFVVSAAIEGYWYNQEQKAFRSGEGLFYQLEYKGPVLPPGTYH
jgi:hypothetical protein